MAYLTVTTLADLIDPNDGKLSLREAIAQANGTAAADTIRFLASLEGGSPLVLTQGELAVTQDLTIDGDRNDDGKNITIDGNANGRIMGITGAGTDVTLRDLALTNGRPGPGEDGGAVFLGGGRLTLSGVIVSDSVAGVYADNGEGGADGGGILAAAGSRLDIAASSFVGNQAGRGNGGAIAARENVGLTIRTSSFDGNAAVGVYQYGGALSLSSGNTALIEESTLSGNGGYNGGAISSSDGSLTILRTTIAENRSTYGGAVNGSSGSVVTLSDSTIAKNRALQEGGGLFTYGTLVIRNSTITSNVCGTYGSGGVFVGSPAHVELSNTIIAGNVGDVRDEGGPDVARGAIAFSNGHNVFGSDVAGAVPGDRENVAPGAIFAFIDPATGGGLLNPNGVVSLRNDVANPALTGADPLIASATGQLGTSPRPLPANSLADIGSIEINQPLSTGTTANNDVITGNGGGNTLSGLDGNDLLRGLGGPDILNAGNGSDVLDGGPGNNRLNGGTGVDLATFAFSSTRVVVDLSGTTDTARRGNQTDLLTDIEGAIGTAKADRFIGDDRSNQFQGGLGRDIATGGAGRDSYDFDRVQDSPPGASRSDRITDFAPGVDVLDLAGIDADPAQSGDQPFVWLGTAPFTGTPGELRYTPGTTTIVQGNIDGDLTAEIEIRLNGNKALTLGDVRL